MKVIFLDIDGVLNNDRTATRSPDGYIGISYSLLKRLSKIVKATDASVVLTSTWKDLSSPQDTAYMMRRFRVYSIIPIGKTKDIKDQRGKGIKDYLEEHPCDEYVILDDFSFDFYEQNLMEHVVLTNPIIGLTEKNVEKAIEILNGKLNEDYQIADYWGYHR